MRLDKIEYKSKTSEILEKGRAERGNFNPSGIPLKMYNFWLENSENHKARAIRLGVQRENFCHFWRVVAIWAPLWAIGILLAAFFESKTGKIISTVALVAFFAVLFALSPDVRIGIAVIAGVVALAAVVVGIGMLFDAYWPRKWNKSIGRFLDKTLPGLAAILAIGAVATALVFAVKGAGWLVLPVIAVLLAALFAGIYGIVTLSDYIVGIRAEKKRKRAEFLDSMTPKEYFDYVSEKKVVRKPGLVSKFFSGVGDFIVLLTQIVRVKKWKICPLVTLDGNDA